MNRVPIIISTSEFISEDVSVGNHDPVSGEAVANAISDAIGEKVEYAWDWNGGDKQLEVVDRVTLEKQTIQMSDVVTTADLADLALGGESEEISAAEVAALWA